MFIAIEALKASNLFIACVHFIPCQPWLRMRGKLQRVDSVVTLLAPRCRTRVPEIDKVKRLIR
jgi:hypothetical protein